jgi:hypothetical protein
LRLAFAKIWQLSPSQEVWHGCESNEANRGWFGGINEYRRDLHELLTGHISLNQIAGKNRRDLSDSQIQIAKASGRHQIPSDVHVRQTKVMAKLVGAVFSAVSARGG